MDRWRLENAHLKYAMLTIAKKYPELSDDRDFLMSFNTTDTSKIFTPKFYESFCRKYGG